MYPALSRGILPLVFCAMLQAQPAPRARDLGVPFDGKPGPLNAITDVKGVEVGHSTIIRDEPGGKAVRTGVTAIFPRPKNERQSAFAGWFSLNGNGEMTGTAWLEESGLLESPILLTNTASVGVVRDTVVAAGIRRRQDWALPVVAETWDGFLNDIDGFHVKPEHVYEAMEKAHGGPVAEGGVGGGTGMVCHEFKGGIGTSSRVAGGYTVGVLVQANYGLRGQLRVAGVPVGREIPEGAFRKDETGSIIIVVATDAPLLPHQLKRLARRASLGLARNGSISGNGSGDIFLAFSTANALTQKGPVYTAEVLYNGRMEPLFGATVEATEEAIINALVAGRDMTGNGGRKIIGLPHERLRAVLKKYNRLVETGQPGVR